MPIVVVQNLSVAANGVSAEQALGPHEYLRGPCALRLRASAAAVGLNMSFAIGERLVVPDMAVPQSNRFPILPDDMITEDASYGGERWSLKFRNTTAAAILVNSVLEIAYA